MSERRLITQSAGGFQFKGWTGTVEWTVYRKDTGAMLGYVRPNGSRIKGRAWTWRTADGTREDRASSRAYAAEALAREAGPGAPVATPETAPAEPLAVEPVARKRARVKPATGECRARQKSTAVEGHTHVCTLTDHGSDPYLHHCRECGRLFGSR